MSAVARTASSLLEGICLPALAKAQNADGGWGFRPGLPSAVEATSWSLLALSNLHDQNLFGERRAKGCRYLTKMQLVDGSWASVRGQKEGGWVTSLACKALQEAEGATGAVQEALDWLCCSWPGEGGTWWRLRNGLGKGSGAVKQDHRLRGWSWTRGTSSWVEPTAYALLALRGVSGPFPSAHLVKRRRALGEAMLGNRMCPGGGWNAGNPYVYGAAGEPLVTPTVFALLALARVADKTAAKNCIETSLDWLERAYESIPGPGSLALAHLCLNAFGRKHESPERRLLEMYGRNIFLQNTVVLAWGALAMQDVPGWLNHAACARN